MGSTAKDATSAAVEGDMKQHRMLLRRAKMRLVSRMMVMARSSSKEAASQQKQEVYVCG